MDGSNPSTRVDQTVGTSIWLPMAMLRGKCDWGPEKGSRSRGVAGQSRNPGRLRREPPKAVLLAMNIRNKNLGGEHAVIETKGAAYGPHR